LDSALFLASASPRRRALLAQIGVRVHVLTVAVDETALPGERADDYVRRLARDKALAGRASPTARAMPRRPVLAADTAVVVGAELLGKPADAAESARMLEKLSARTHEVLTAVALATGGDLKIALSRSEVTFRAISAAEARRYWDTGEPHDKAGGYAIQGLGAVFVRELRGSFTGVMGLPLYETAALLSQAGVPLWEPVADENDEH
jgi:septum formation protein